MRRECKNVLFSIEYERTDEFLVFFSFQRFIAPCSVLLSLDYLLTKIPHFRFLLSRAVNDAIKLLQARHKTHIKHYGRNNERRVTGRHETANVS